MRFNKLFGILTIFLVLALTLIVVKSELVVTYESTTNLLEPRFGTTGNSILYVERRASGIAIGPGIEFFTPPARMHLFKDEYILKEMDLDGRHLATHFSWTIPRQQFFIPAYRNRLFGFPTIRLEMRNDFLFLYCRVVETHYPNVIVHTEEMFWDLHGQRRASRESFNAEESIRPWHQNRLSGAWEVMLHGNQVILLELLENGVSQQIRVVRSSGAEPLNMEMIRDNLVYLRMRPRLEKLEKTRQTKKQLEESYIAIGMSTYQARLRAIDDLEELGFIPKSTRIVARPIDKPLIDIPVFTISDDEFKVGLFQDIDQAIDSPGKQVRHWGNYLIHRDFTTSRFINAHLEEHRDLQVKTSRGLFVLRVVN